MKIWTSHPSLLLVYVFPEQILHFLNLRNLPITKSLIFSVSSAFLPKSTRPLLNSPPLHFVSQWMFYKALIDYFEQQCEFDNIEDIVTNIYVSWQFTEVRWFSDALHLRCSLLQIPPETCLYKIPYRFLIGPTSAWRFTIFFMKIFGIREAFCITIKRCGIDVDKYDIDRQELSTMMTKFGAKYLLAKFSWNQASMTSYKRKLHR